MRVKATFVMMELCHPAQLVPGPEYKVDDQGGYLYLGDGRRLERWAKETYEHAILRNNCDWRPAVKSDV